MTRDDDEGLDTMATSMRSLWRELPDEEPPSRGLDALLAAARSKASEMAPETREQRAPDAAPWWKRMFGVLARPPVLAACTALVLVGATVMLTRRDDAPMMATAHSREPASTELSGRQARPVAESQAAPIPEARGESEIRRDRSITTAPEPKAATPEAIRATPRPADKARKPPSVEDAFMPTDNEGGVGGSTPQPSDSLATSGARGDEQPKRPEPVGIDAVAIEPGRTQSTAPVTGRAPSSEQLLKQAETAANRNDCAAVRATTERIRKVDGVFYKERVVIQPAIKRCL